MIDISSKIVSPHKLHHSFNTEIQTKLPQLRDKEQKFRNRERKRERTLRFEKT